MTSRRQRLLCWLGPGAKLQSSYLPGRSGFVLSSSRSLAALRCGSRAEGAARIVPLHLESGRFFLEPTAAWLTESLGCDQPPAWWSPAHQQGATRFFDSLRLDRVRRLPAGVHGNRSWTRAFRAVRDLALRLEALSVTPRPDKHWAGLARSFDELWRGSRLTSMPADPLWAAVREHLWRCRKEWESGFPVALCRGKD